MSLISTCLIIGVLWSQEVASSIEILVQTGADRVNTDVSTWEIAIQVQDNNGRKVPGAAVVFQLPANAGTFLNGSTMVTAITDLDGRATVRGFRPGRLRGAFVIRINASFRGLHASVSVTQTNPFKPQALNSATPVKQLVLGVVAAAAAAGLGVYFGVHDTGIPTPTSITLGPGQVTPAARNQRR